MRIELRNYSLGQKMIPKGAKEELLNICNTLRAIWNHESDDDRFSPVRQLIEVRTTASHEAELLPKTGKPIRGRNGVEVIVGYQGLSRGSISTMELINDAFTRHWYLNDQPASYENEKERLEEQLDRLFDILDEISGLPERVFESFGYKEYEADELKKAAIEGESPPNNTIRKYSQERVLVDLLTESLNALGFQASAWQFFNNWEAAVEDTLCKIVEFASRQENQYEVIAFLNAPLVDSDYDISLGVVRLSGGATELFISYASDELLARIFDNVHLLYLNSSERIETINSVLKYRTSVKCDASVESYLNLYKEATLAFGKIADVIRVVRNEDIGIQALEVIPGRWATPRVLKKYATTYQPKYSTFFPRRSYFLVESAEAISDEQVELLRKLIPAHVNDEIKLVGLPVAMQRFRDSQERYSPYDLQSLLDIAIAFEAVFLNDTDNTQELSYRLAMRIARFLGESKATRIEIFDLIRNLYGFRSKLAHGATFDNLRKIEAQKLKQVYDGAPNILRQALRKFLEGHGPIGLKQQDIANWWKQLELA